MVNQVQSCRAHAVFDLACMEIEGKDSRDLRLLYDEEFL